MFFVLVFLRNALSVNDARLDFFLSIIFASVMWIIIFFMTNHFIYLILFLKPGSGFYVKQMPSLPGLHILFSCIVIENLAGSMGQFQCHSTCTAIISMPYSLYLVSHCSLNTVDVAARCTWDNVFILCGLLRCCRSWSGMKSHRHCLKGHAAASLPAD